MQLIWERMRSTSVRDLGRPARPDDLPQLWCCHGGEPGGVLSVPAGMPSVWIPLRGSLVVDCAHGLAELDESEVLVWNGDGPLRGYARSAREYLVLAWGVAPTPWRPTPSLLSAPQPPSRQLLSAAQRVDAAGRRDSPAPWSDALLFDQLLYALHALQSAFDPLLQRCPGKSREARRQAFARLLRVRNMVRFEQAPEFGVAEMARLASYSPCHFIRVFHHVFGETPHEYVLRHRLARAAGLLRDSDLAIAEISSQLGFSGSSAFARAVRHHFGRTATELRSLGRQSREAARTAQDLHSLRDAFGAGAWPRPRSVA